MSAIRSVTPSPPAPLDPADLAAALAPFGDSRGLPRAAYLDPDVLAWERRHVFGGWVAVARADLLSASRTTGAVSVGDSGVLLARDATGVLRAFENACRHRGHELLACGEVQQPRAIICPYHSWAYDFDGSLRGAPGFQHVAGFDPSEHALHALPVVEWHGWVLVEVSGSKRDFAEHVGDLEDIVAPYDAGRLVTAATHRYDVAANWKLIIENFQECYHCSTIHPALCKVSPPTSGHNLEPVGEWLGGSLDLRPGAETMSLDGRTGGVVLPGLGERELRTVMYVVVLPNLLISLHPDYVMTHLLTPLDVDRTHIECSWAFPPEAVERPGFDAAYAVDFWDLTNRQDWAACESVQRGVRSPGYVPGPLAPAEDGVYQFITKMASCYHGD